MLKVKNSGQFKKNYKKCIKLLKGVVATLAIPEPLQEKNRDHNLTGNYAGYRECHILPDWLLIYRYNGEYLELARTGTHADLFNK